jgi:hypothetical protein
MKRRRSEIGRIIAVALCGLSALAWADITNTALITFVDGSGQTQTVPSNTVTVVVNATGMLPPQIQGFNSFSYYLKGSDSLTLRLAGGPPESIQWEFTATSGVNGTSGTPRLNSASSAPDYAISTSASTLPLSTVHQLTPGAWHVKVTAVNAAGNSNSAEADFALVLDDLAQARVHPNPWRVDRHDGNPITFDQLSVNSTVKVFTISGHLIRTLSAPGGSVTWDLKNSSGEKVASGLYLYLITSDPSQKFRGTLAVIR